MSRFIRRTVRHAQRKSIEFKLQNICAKTDLTRRLLGCNGVHTAVQVSAHALVLTGSLNGKY